MESAEADGAVRRIAGVYLHVALHALVQPMAVPSALACRTVGNMLVTIN